MIGIQPGFQLGGLPREVAEAWPLVEDVLCLAQHRTGATAVAEADVATGQLEQGLGGHNGQCGAEQRPQASGPRDVLTCALQIASMQRAANAYTSALVQYRDAWAAVGAIVGHFWHHIPRDSLRRAERHARVRPGGARRRGREPDN